MFFSLFSDDLKFWLETIRCYEAYHSSDRDKSHKIPVFIVGTHKDKFKVDMIISVKYIEFKRHRGGQTKHFENSNKSFLD